MEDLELHIPSIGCQGCMKKIVTKLETLPGLEIVHTDVATKTLRVRYTARETSPEQIGAALSAIGYPVAGQASDQSVSHV